MIPSRRISLALPDLAVAIAQGRDKPLYANDQGPNLILWLGATFLWLVMGLILIQFLSGLLPRPLIPFIMVAIGLLECLRYEHNTRLRLRRPAFELTDAHDVLLQVLARLTPHAATRDPSHLELNPEGDAFRLNAALTVGELMVQVNTSSDGLVFKAMLTTPQRHPAHRPPGWGWQRLDVKRDVTFDGRTVTHAEGTWLGDLRGAGPALGDLLGALIAPPQRDDASAEGVVMRRAPSTQQAAAHLDALPERRALLQVEAPVEVDALRDDAPRRSTFEAVTQGAAPAFFVFAVIALYLTQTIEAWPWLLAGLITAPLAPMGWIVSASLPREPPRLLHVRQDTRRTPWLRWQAGRLALGVGDNPPTHAVDLDEPFKVTLTRDDAFLGVAVRQQGSTRPRDQLHLRVPLTLDAASRELPRLQTDAPRMDARDFTAWLWPLLSRRLEIQGTPTPWRVSLPDHEGVAAAEVVEAVAAVKA